MNKKTSKSYDVGYAKPPKDAQFQKGMSGNPKRRPKKVLDFHQESIRESNSSMTINENGRPKSLRRWMQILARHSTAETIRRSLRDE